MRQNFVITITHRQNATWQGSVTWVEENRTQSFRSALELLRLMDSAVDPDHADWQDAGEAKQDR